ncbi:MAG: hypothetical protein ACLFWF_01555 [Alphaproteobacteria bacterium]
MNRMLFFAAGLIAGFGAAFLTGMAAFPHAEAAAALEFQDRNVKPLKRRPVPEPGFLRQQCAPGFEHSPDASGRYTCARERPVRCPNGATPVNLKLYRSGSAGASGRLIYECRMSERVRLICGQGYGPSDLRLYRSGNAGGDSRLMYECVRYRKGN